MIYNACTLYTYLKVVHVVSRNVKNVNEVNTGSVEQWVSLFLL